jgi:type II secretory pathway component GspD/PulD (secretin)
MPSSHAVAQQPSAFEQFLENVRQSAANPELIEKTANPFAGTAEEQGGEDGGPASQGDPAAGGNAAPLPGPTEETLPAPRVEGLLPPVGTDAADDVQLTQNGPGLITLVARDAALSRVLALLAQTQGLNIVAANDIDAVISITLRDVPLEEALTAILSVANYTWVRKNNIILITSLAGSANLPASVQGRQIRVFDLDFAKASVVAEAIKELLSPIGKTMIHESDSANNRQTREMVVVEDLPESLARVAAYINYVDQPPRQVQIEAHILHVTLDDTNQQGVDLEAMIRLANSDLTLKTVGFADPDASPAFLATIEGGDLTGVIELLQTTSDTKSLGSPKLLVLNEQEARIQVGEQLGFRVTTTTETSTMENVQFLDVGVVLSLTPRITRDHRVLLHVKPEVSRGEVNPDTGLPEEETTELETDVMLEDGQGMVIGGLIKESDSVVQSKVPYLGDVRYLGWFFRRSEVVKKRVEVIIALVPRVQPYNSEWQAFEQGELVKAGVPLMDGPLCRTNRPWDPVLPDGCRVTKPLIPRQPLCPPERPGYPRGTDYYVPRHPLPEQRYAGDRCELMPGHDGAARPAAPFLSDESLPPPNRVGDEGEDGGLIGDRE